MRITLQTANVTGDPQNCSYPNKAVATNPKQLQEAVKMDHVCAEYRNNYRSAGNFIRSGTVVMDCDNDHTDDPDGWITPEKLGEMMPDVQFAAAPSRNNAKDKKDKSARPRFHAYFPIGEMTDPEEYADLKRRIHSKYPFFYTNALDASRFIFGADEGEVTWNDGWTTIDEELEAEEGAEAATKTLSGGLIPSGCRNSTMSWYAGKLLKRYGNTDKAESAYMEYADKCEPPLSPRELSTIWTSAVSFFKNKIAGSDSYVPPDEYAARLAARTLKPYDFTDVGQAEVLAREYGSRLRYSDQTKYLYYDGKRWIENEQLAVGIAVELTDRQMEEAEKDLEEARQQLIDAGMLEADTGNRSATELKKCAGKGGNLYRTAMATIEFHNFVTKRRDYRYITAALNAAKPMLLIDVHDLDKNEFLLNTPEATYNLREGLAGAYPHDPEDLITKMTSCSPGDEGEKEWLAALEVFFCGDQELISYIQCVVGLAAIGKVLEEIAIIAVGCGNNGKSSFWNAIFRVLGDYAKKLSAEVLTMSCNRNTLPEKAELRGCRLVILSELQENMQLNTAVMKQLTSTDEIEAAKKYKDPFHFVPSHTLVLYTNHLPAVATTDHGTWRRLKVVPFNAQITAASDIKNYADYLVEHAGPAIMSWIIEGAKKVIDADFKIPIPKAVEEATAAYKNENDWLSFFIEECCEEDGNAEAKSGELYSTYRAYAMQCGETVRSTREFYDTLQRAGFSRYKKNTGSFVRGLKLQQEEDGFGF